LFNISRTSGSWYDSHFSWKLLIELVDQFDKNAILENYNKDFGTKDKKVFSQDLLAFITPW